MTPRTRLSLRGLLLVCGTLAPLLPAAVLADPPPPREKPPDLPEPLVARIRDAHGAVSGEITRDELSRALARKSVADLVNMGSAASTILRGICEERIVRQEGRRLGLVVSQAEVQAEEQRLDTQLRRQAGGQQNLAQLRQLKGMSAENFRSMLELELLKEKIAGHPAHLGKLPVDERQRVNQISVVIIELHKGAKMQWGVPNALSDKLIALPDGVLVTVSGDPVTLVDFGAALLRSLQEDDIKDVLLRECTTKVLESEGVQLSDAAMEAELKLREALWPVQRSLMGDDRWRTLEFDAYLKGVLKFERQELIRNPYYRSYYGLVASERAKVPTEKILQEFMNKKDSHYGKAVVVHGLQVGFERKSTVFGTTEGREKRDALQILLAAKQSIAAGRPFSDAVREIHSRYRDPRNPSLPDPTVREGLRRLFFIPADELLWRHAEHMQDGEVSQVIETLSEVYLIRREREEPARTLAEVREVVRESLAGTAARWRLEDILQKTDRVQMRWPLRGK